jgi:type IV secretory pathway VirB9-like protein
MEMEGEEHMKTLVVAAILLACNGCLADPGYRLVEAKESSVVRINARVRYVTWIEFPEGEEVQAAPIGDGAAVAPNQTPAEAVPNWEIWGFPNAVAVKPLFRGVRTSMVVHTKSASGGYHSTAFELVEGTGTDIKVSITRVYPHPLLNPDAVVVASLKEDVAARDERVNELQVLLAGAERQLKRERDSGASKIDPEHYFGKIHADYKLGKHAGAAPFLISQVFSDGRFTYIKCASMEPPSFYSSEDGKLLLVDYKYRSGQYVISRVVDRGVLRIGKKEVKFEREARDAGNAGK